MPTLFTMARAFIATTTGRVVALLVAAVLVGGSLIATRESTAPGGGVPRTVAVTRGAIDQTVRVSGALNAATSVRLTFKTPGRVAEIPVVVGRRVAPGDVLARLDQTDLAAAFGQAQAALAQAQARYDLLVAGAPDEDVRIVRQAVDNASRSLEAAQRSAAADAATAREALAKVRTNFAAARANLTLLVADVRRESGLIDLTAANAQLDKARADLNVEVNAAGGGTTNAPPPAPSQTVADGKTAQAALASAAAALTTAGAIIGGPLPAALADAAGAADGLADITGRFDTAVQQGDDVSGLDASFQTQQSIYVSAAARVTTLLGSVNVQLAAAQTAVGSALGTLATTASRNDFTYEVARGELVPVQSSLIAQADHASTSAAKFAQASGAVGVLTDSVVGGYVAAVQGVASTDARSHAAVVAAQNALDGANAVLAKTLASPRTADLASARAGLDAASAAAEAARANLDGAVLRSPSAGVVAAVNGSAGELASGATPFIVIADTASIVLRGTAGEAEVAKLALGQAATVTVDAAGAAARLSGRVTDIDPVATIVQGVPLYGVEVTIDAPGATIRPGMSGTASIVVSTKSGALVVPGVAVSAAGGRHYVQLVKDGRPVNTEVALGIQNDTLAELVSGVREGDQVVLPAAR